MTTTTTPPHASEQANERIAAYVPGQWFDARTLDEMQAFYLSRLPAIREAAKEHGYAIGLHGSLRRDFDLMAMQWRDGAADKDTLARAVADAACGIRREGAYDWERKPNGRFATSIPICWTDHENPEFDNMLSLGHVDMSVITQQVAPEAPIPMILYCPKCGVQHIDAPETHDMVVGGVVVDKVELWENPPHRSHLCHGCGNIWRPADVPTEGVAAIKTCGANDAAPEAPASEQPANELTRELAEFVVKHAVADHIDTNGPDCRACACCDKEIPINSSLHRGLTLEHRDDCLFIKAQAILASPAATTASASGRKLMDIWNAGAKALADRAPAPSREAALPPRMSYAAGVTRDYVNGYNDARRDCGKAITNDDPAEIAEPMKGPTDVGQ
jgi:hypothetical protein